MPKVTRKQNDVTLLPPPPPPTTTHIPALSDGLPLPKMIVFDLDFTLWPFWADTHVSPPLMKRTSVDRGLSVRDSTGEGFKFYDEVPRVLGAIREAGIVIGAASRTSAPRLAREILTALTIPVSEGREDGQGQGQGQGSGGVIDGVENESGDDLEHDDTDDDDDIARDGKAIDWSGLEKESKDPRNETNQRRPHAKKKPTPRDPRCVDSRPSTEAAVQSSGRPSARDQKSSAHAHAERVSALKVFSHIQIFPGDKTKHFRALQGESRIPFADMLFFDDERRNANVETLGVYMHLVPNRGVCCDEVEKGIVGWRRRRRDGHV